VKIVTALVALLVCCAPVTYAQTFPAKPVRILVGFAPGGSTDVTARIFAQELSKLWGTQVVVENRPGASGMIGADVAAKAPPDGYTWLVSPQTSIVVAPLIFKKVPYDPARDFAPVAVIGSTPQLLVVHPSMPPRTFKEFTAFVRSNASQLSYASGGFGSTPHMAGELLNTSLKVRVTHVPYKGENPGVADLLGGQVPYMFSNLPIVLPHVQANRLRALAITSLKRSPLAPEFPTIDESGLRGFDTATWSGLYVPSATPRELVKRIHADIFKIMTAPEFQKRMLQQGIDQSEANTPEKHAAYLKTELTRWSRVIAEAGVKAE
jgi:tripartite-type tricarboxylate transporter receptor subunit TctC